MARRHPILRVFTLLAVGALVAGALVAGLALFGGGLGERPLYGNVVGVVELRGVIQDASDLVEALERFRTSEATVAVVLRIDSPGGAVAPSQEITTRCSACARGASPSSPRSATWPHRVATTSPRPRTRSSPIR